MYSQQVMELLKILIMSLSCIYNMHYAYIQQYTTICNNEQSVPCVYCIQNSADKVRVLNVEFALKLKIYRSLKSLICLNESERSFPQHCILTTQFNYLT